MLISAYACKILCLLTFAYSFGAILREYGDSPWSVGQVICANKIST